MNRSNNRGENMKKPKGKGWIKISKNKYRKLNKTAHWVKIKNAKGILTTNEVKRAKQRVKKFYNPKSGKSYRVIK